MDFRQLQYLLILAQCRNMTRAAEKLYISQSALSHYVKNVEEELGVQLFDRSTSPMSLTYAGQCYMESARRILAEEERLSKELRDITLHMTGKLTLGSSRDRASYMMPRILPAFSSRYPGIETEVYTASGKELLDALRSGRVDMVLLPSNWQDDARGLWSESIYREELVLAAKAGTLPQEARLPGKSALRPEALDNMPFFALFQGHAMRSFCDSFFKRSHIRPQIKMEFSSNISCLRMAATGMGVTIIPYLTTQMSNPGGEIELFSLGAGPVTWDVRIFFRKDAYLGRPELDLIQMTKELFSNEIYST